MGAFSTKPSQAPLKFKYPREQPTPVKSIVPDFSGKYVEPNSSLNFAKRYGGKTRRSKNTNTRRRRR
jgi:hypothetical protein